MAKIGFLADAYKNGGSKNDGKNGKGNDSDAAQDEREKKASLLRELIEANFEPQGDRADVLLLTTDDVRFFFRHTLYARLEELNRVLKAMGFNTVVVGNRLCWQLYMRQRPKVGNDEKAPQDE